MKTAIAILFTALSISAYSQKSFNFNLDNGNLDIYLKEDVSIDSVKKVFNMSDILLPTKCKFYDRYVYTKTKTYYRAGIGLFRKPKVYEIVNGKF